MAVRWSGSSGVGFFGDFGEPPVWSHFSRACAYRTVTSRPHIRVSRPVYRPANSRGAGVTRAADPQCLATAKPSTNHTLRRHGFLAYRIECNHTFDACRHQRTACANHALARSNERKGTLSLIRIPADRLWLVVAGSGCRRAAAPPWHASRRAAGRSSATAGGAARNHWRGGLGPGAAPAPEISRN